MFVLAQNCSGKRNRSELAYDLICRDILHGQLFPQDKLSLEGLSKRYEIVTATLREALNRLLQKVCLSARVTADSLSQQSP